MTVHSNTGHGDTVTASCPSGQRATGGGGNTGSSKLIIKASYPVFDGNVARGWAVEWLGDSDAPRTTYVLCG